MGSLRHHHDLFQYLNLIIMGAAPYHPSDASPFLEGVRSLGVLSTIESPLERHAVSEWAGVCAGLFVMGSGFGHSASRSDAIRRGVEKAFRGYGLEPMVTRRTALVRLGATL
jgi:hypothetical protein